MSNANNTGIGYGLINTDNIYNDQFLILNNSIDCFTSVALEFSKFDDYGWWLHSQSSPEFSDWFLPSKDELELIISTGVLNYDENEFYWSSSIR